ncbi:hypothetical protein AMATHDRAFT_77450 [Amanita thiersii Skay4041]|uniref:NAD(P)-binding protein n=1 Tax=Amanita thiersii Skay4041 TaxID=703135 RepID=A0A2A9NF63_9AGAR|nr:hypothetical protein AMATHDRAFT_77450 [Amanita thiersii Skay4041]
MLTLHQVLARFANSVSLSSSHLHPLFTNKRTILTGLISLLLLSPKFLRLLGLTGPRRLSYIPPGRERVLILGASSGIGKSLAEHYSKRGAYVCVIGRRAVLVDEVVQECRGLSGKEGRTLGVTADFTQVDDMVRVRNIIREEWGGLDTLVVAAGVSALQPLMDVAGAHGITGRNPSESVQSTTEGIQCAKDVADAATKGNYVGPLVAAVTFIPLLQATSPSPSVLLISSLASVIPAPTRTLYASTKAAALVLYQALSIEHPRIRFTHFMPSTVEGDFRASAVDAGPVREQDPNRHGLKRADVARRCIRAVDEGERTVFMPWTMGLAHLAYWIIPGVIEWAARRNIFRLFLLTQNVLED